MSNEETSVAEGDDNSSPTDLVLPRQHLQNRWSAPANEGEEEYQVKWEDHRSQLASMVASLENDEASSDVRVVTKGASISSHRLVLASASPFFNYMLQGLPATHIPVIVIKTEHPRYLRYLISFCYRGTITLHSKEVPQVLQLAEDLEIRGLKITLAEGRSSPPYSPFAALHPRFFPPNSPSEFPFTAPLHHHRPSSATPTSLGYSDMSSSNKRTSSPSDHKERQSKKLKVEPLPMDRDTRPHSNPSPYYTPPGSAPPLLPTLPLFFKPDPASPPVSAPPQTIGDSFPLLNTSPAAEDTKDQDPTTVSVVSPSRLLHPSSRSSSRPPSPQLDATTTTTTTTSTPPSVAQTPPNGTRTTIKEPSTPSTPARLGTDPNNSGGVGGSSGSRVLLWRFLLDLLHNPRYTPIYIRWLDRPAGIFRIMESDMVAQLWGLARKNNNMNYEKMSRGMRTYYKRGILFHIDGTKLIYKFNTSDPEIEQRMRYYDLTQANSEGELSADQNTSPSLLPTSTVSSLSSVSPVTASATSSLESFYGPLFRDMTQLPHSLLYEPYISFLRASRPELY